MNNPSYIATNIDELFDEAPVHIQALISGTEVNNATAVLGKIYKLPVSSYLALSNLISFILIGALKPEDVPRAFVDVLKLSEDDAMKLASDLDKSILEKARIQVMGKAPTDMVELTFPGGRSPDELRKEILDTTKRESALAKEQSSVEKTDTSAPVSPSMGQEPAPETAPAVPGLEVDAETTGKEKKMMVAPGSRSQLLEQLQILDSIPDDEEIADRLSKIQEQIASIEKKDDSELDTNVPLHNFMFGEKGDDEVRPELKAATYSKAPTKYNVDPYREQVEE